MVARLKLKGIDGHPHKQWSMLFNSKLPEESYLGLTSPAKFWKQSGGYPGDRWCMVVVSSCREMFG